MVAAHLARGFAQPTSELAAVPAIAYVVGNPMAWKPGPLSGENARTVGSSPRLSTERAANELLLAV